MNITDYDSVDLIVRNFPLAEIDSHLKASEAMLDEVDDDLKWWWQGKIDDLKLAQELAEYCIMNNIPTVDIKPETKTRERGLYALEKIKHLEEKVYQLEEQLQRATKYFSTKQEPKVELYE